MRRSPAWMVLWSIASAASAQVDEASDVRALNDSVPPAQPAQASQPAQGSRPAGNGLRFGMPPIYWRGALGLDFRYNRVEGEPTRREQLITAGVGAMTYLYAPWVATLDGYLNLTTGVTRYDDAAASRDDNNFATGSLSLTTFPRSRFPTDLRYEVSDTRFDSTLGGGVDYRTSRLSLTQRYRPVNNEFTVTANYERRTQDGLSFGRDTQDYLLLDFATSWKRQQLSAALTSDRNRTEGTGQETNFTSIYARHNYFGDNSLTIDSGANWNRSDDHLLSGDRAVTVAQAASIAVWNSPTMPLSVTGSVRALSFQQDGEIDTSSLAAGVGATYEFNPNARVGGSLIFTRFDERNTLTTVGQITGTYQGDTRQLGPVDWTWFGGAGLGAQRSDGQRDERLNAALSGQLGHTLSRTWPTGASSWSVNLSQAVSAALERRSTLLDESLLDDRVSRAVTQTLAFNWSRPGDRGAALGRLSLSDARQLDGAQNHFQQVNFQLSGTHDVDRYRGWSADLTAQYTSQESLVLQRGDGRPFIRTSSQNNQSAGGEIAWRDNRLFNVPRLNFTSRLRVSLNTQNQSDQLVPLPDRDLASWENRVDYRVGRLESSIVLRVSKVDDRQQVFAMWRLQRTFGG